jgi:hypothetical protein
MGAGGNLLSPLRALKYCLQVLELERSALGTNVRGRSQREKIPGRGASGY